MCESFHTVCKKWQNPQRDPSPSVEKAGRFPMLLLFVEGHRDINFFQISERDIFFAGGDDDRVVPLGRDIQGLMTYRFKKNCFRRDASDSHVDCPRGVGGHHS
jgi:hypothetical protein